MNRRIVRSANRKFCAWWIVTPTAEAVRHEASKNNKSARGQAIRIGADDSALEGGVIRLLKSDRPS